jgi:spore maturation protein CgeB
MKLVVFGLSISSSWGNGHATHWRGLAGALAAGGHLLVFFERDVDYYASHRDLAELQGGELVLYPSWSEALPLAVRQLADADAAIVTSYCPDAIAASELVLESGAQVRAFYDLDTPVTLDLAQSGRRAEYIPPWGLSRFDVVLSFTGGRALSELKSRLGAQLAFPLYGSVDPRVHFQVEGREDYGADLSYLGTWAANRQESLGRLLLSVAARQPGRTFVIGGAQYPSEFPWAENIKYVRHLAPSEHSAFYSSSPLTLNVTRAPMATMGFCPSGRLFEAAACGVPVVSDPWDGLDSFFTPGEEILLARDTDDVIEALERGPLALSRIGRAARQRALSEHTAEHRVRELLRLLQIAKSAGRGVELPGEAGEKEGQGDVGHHSGRR